MRSVGQDSSTRRCSRLTRSTGPGSWLVEGSAWSAEGVVVREVLVAGHVASGGDCVRGHERPAASQVSRRPVRVGSSGCPGFTLAFVSGCRHRSRDMCRARCPRRARGRVSLPSAGLWGAPARTRQRPVGRPATAGRSWADREHHAALHEPVRVARDHRRGHWVGEVGDAVGAHAPRVLEQRGPLGAGRRVLGIAGFEKPLHRFFAVWNAGACASSR